MTRYEQIFRRMELLYGIDISGAAIRFSGKRKMAYFWKGPKVVYYRYYIILYDIYKNDIQRKLLSNKFFTH